MCEIAIGSDTGGSTRIPAAFCGIVGYKPSKYRVPTEGAFPLSYTLDSIGPMAKTVAQCAAADAVMANEDPWTLDAAPLFGLRLGIAQGLPLGELDPTVSARFAAAMKALARGAHLSDETLPLLDDMVRLNAKFTLASVEGFAIHRERLDTRGGDFDPDVRARLEPARMISAADYIASTRERTFLVRAMADRLGDLDALVMPTVPIVAPALAEVSASRDVFAVQNRLSLRNTAIVNYFDLCAISLPLPREGGLPVGLMLVAKNGDDGKLFRIAAAVERLFAA
jgi:aspartyl-tRNA(Asn)/glutamyl-tRNA(Gln) amidotransferase subunit A